jgi:ABC-type Fe3+-citrate transport system substrate-binding protein
MTPAVKLMDLTDSIECVSEESGAWLDRQTGRVVVVENEVIRAVEEVEGNVVPVGLEDWQQAQLTATRVGSRVRPRIDCLAESHQSGCLRLLSSVA